MLNCFPSQTQETTYAARVYNLMRLIKHSRKVCNLQEAKLLPIVLETAREAFQWLYLCYLAYNFSVNLYISIVIIATLNSTAS